MASAGGVDQASQGWEVGEDEGRVAMESVSVGDEHQVTEHLVLGQLLGNIVIMIRRPQVVGHRTMINYWETQVIMKMFT